jgi:hypothetical protein
VLDLEAAGYPEVVAEDREKVTDDGWFDFGKQYLHTLKHQFVPQFLDTPDDDDSVRLFYEPARPSIEVRASTGHGGGFQRRTARRSALGSL